MSAKNVKFGICCIVFLVCSITPAVAVQMESVAHEAEQYNEDSKKDMGFWAKISFINKGFTLLSKAETAQKESDKANQKTGKEKSLGEKYDTLANRNNQELFNECLNKMQRDGKTIKNNKGVIVSVSDVNLPNLEANADEILQALGLAGIKATRTFHREIDAELEGHIVQLITNEGKVRYFMVKKVEMNTINLNNTNNTDIDSNNSTGSTSNSVSDVTIVKNEGIEETLSLESFKKAYTGITFNTESKLTCLEVVNKIKQIKNKSIEKNTQEAEELISKAWHNVLLSEIGIAVSIILVAVGICLMLWFSQGYGAKRAASLAAQAALAAAEARKAMAYEGIVATTETMERVGYNDITALTAANQAQAEYIAARNAVVTARGSAQAAAAAVAQDYVTVVIKVVGIILEIVGIIGFIIGLIATIYYRIIVNHLDKIIQTNENDLKTKDTFSIVDNIKITPSQ